MNERLSARTPILPSTLERERSGTEGSSMETEQRLGETGRETDRPHNKHGLVMFLYNTAHVSAKQVGVGAAGQPGNLQAPGYSSVQFSSVRRYMRSYRGRKGREGG